MASCGYVESLYLLLGVYDVEGFKQYISNLIFTIFLLIMQLTVVYTNVYLLIPRFLTTRKYTLYFIFLLGLFMLIAFVIYQFLSQNILDKKVFDRFEEERGGDLYFFSIFMTVFSTSLPTLILIFV